MQQFKDKRPVFIFDFGGVVIIWRNNDPIFRYVAQKYNIPFAKMQRVMNNLLPDLEVGKISCSQFLRRSLARFGRKLRRRDDPEKLITIPFARGSRLRKGVVEIIQKLEKQGYEVDVLSNTNEVHLKFMNKSGWTELFHDFFVSCKLGVLKPNMDAYKKVLRKINVGPRDVVFIDNQVDNVLGAKQAGIKESIKFHSVAALRHEIRRIMQQYQ
jgi:HAD superfamily hydrolase (TIGR01509 family)